VFKPSGANYEKAHGCHEKDGKRRGKSQYMPVFGRGRTLAISWDDASDARPEGAQGGKPAGQTSDRLSPLQIKKKRRRKIIYCHNRKERLTLAKKGQFMSGRNAPGKAWPLYLGRKNLPAEGHET